MQNLQKLLDDADSAASAAEQFRDAAQSSAGNALSQAQGAAGSASSALSSAQESATSAANALKSAQDAALSASNAEASALAASQTATNVSNELVSTHNYSSSAHKNLFDSKLSLAGGTMTGGITFAGLGEGTGIRRNNTDTFSVVRGGTTYTDGASVYVSGKDATDGSIGGAGGLCLRASTSATNTTDVILKPNGVFSCKGKNIVRSVDGVNADTAGNVALNALPKSGGTLTGTVTFSLDNAIVRSTNTNLTLVCGGTNWSNGASIALYGKSESENPGCVIIYTNNGTKQSSMLFKPDGTLTCSGKDITLGYPNYAAGVAVGTVSSYTATADGWIQAQQLVHDNYWGLRVGGVPVFYSGGSDYDGGVCFIPVKKGNVITTTYCDNVGGTVGAACPVVMKFYPNR